MPNITKLDRNGLKAVREELGRILYSAGRDMGLTFKVGNGSYDREGRFGSFKIEISLLGGNNRKEIEPGELFRSIASAYGLETSQLGQTITANDGTLHRVLGMVWRGIIPKVLVENTATSGLSTMTTATVAHCFRKQAKVA